MKNYSRVSPKKPFVLQLQPITPSLLSVRAPAGVGSKVGSLEVNLLSLHHPKQSCNHVPYYPGVVLS